MRGSLALQSNARGNTEYCLQMLQATYRICKPVSLRQVAIPALRPVRGKILAGPGACEPVVLKRQAAQYRMQHDRN